MLPSNRMGYNVWMCGKYNFAQMSLFVGSMMYDKKVFKHRRLYLLYLLYIEVWQACQILYLCERYFLSNEIHQMGHDRGS